MSHQITAMKLDTQRVWRTYKGGKLLSEFYGDNQGDNQLPEQWLLSVVEAHNAGRENIKEGTNKLKNSDILLKDFINKHTLACLGEKHVKKFDTNPALLVKLIDSSERLSIQVHPNKKTAKKLFHSQFGKTESWHILGVRKDCNVQPCVYLGFKKGITREIWIDLFERQDIKGMIESLNKIDVKEGDTILVEGGVPHAIGAGCFLLEVQEPTDYTIRVEKTSETGLKIADEMCHQGIGFKKMFDCFEYIGYSEEEIRAKWVINAKGIHSNNGGKIESLISYDNTPLFQLQKLTVLEDMEVSKNGFSGLFVLSGKGTLEADDFRMDLSAGDSLFVPYCTKKYKLKTLSDTLVCLQYFGECFDC